LSEHKTAAPKLYQKRNGGGDDAAHADHADPTSFPVVAINRARLAGAAVDLASRHRALIQKSANKQARGRAFRVIG